MAEPPSTDALTCPNCFAAWTPPRPAFCPHCGQDTRLRPPTMGEFVQQFGGAFVSTEGALWRTLGLLLFKPGELTWQYLAGRRKHYVLPLRLYLTISVLVLLAMRTLASINFNVEPAAIDLGTPQRISIDLGVGRAGLQDGKFFCTQLPAWLCKRLERRLDLEPKAMQRETAEFGGRFVANLGAAMFVLLPLYSLWLKLAWWGRRARYTEHLVAALHLHALWFLLGSLWLFGVDALSAAVAVVLPLHTLLALRRIYGGRWWSLLLRAGGVTLLYLISLGVVMAGLGVYTFVF